MKINSADFITSAPDFASCPETSMPEFAMIGRSNVGKSSLINMLTGRRALAKVSATPGKTDMINFFSINRTWLLVDLPGYGFARATRSRREGFSEAVDDYIEDRENLVALFVLIDSRLPPQAIDLNFIVWLERLSRRWYPVFTKADKQSATQTRRSIDAVRAEIEKVTHRKPEFFVTSTETQAGRGEILGTIGRLCEEARRPVRNPLHQAPALELPPEV